MQKILVFGAGKSATSLIDFLKKTAETNNWQVVIADSNYQAAASKAGNSPNVKAIGLDVGDEGQRSLLIQDSDIVISLLPPTLHLLIAKDCLEHGKNLLTASYTDNAIRELKQELENRGLLFLCEMGLDPGIDHMSAMQIIHRIQKEQGEIRSFRSHCGGLVAPESDDNPWHYKISWNPRNVVMAGSAGAVYKEAGKIRNIPYQQLFKDCGKVSIPDLAQLAYYPNRDSLSYIPLYGLESAVDFVRTTLRFPEFCTAWQYIIEAGLTDDKTSIAASLTFKEWSKPILPFITSGNKDQFIFLGLLDDAPVPEQAKTSADVLQYLLESKLAMQPQDKDMIVMLHEFEYTLKGQLYKLNSSLVVEGEDSIHTAMAKTVGLPLGIAAKLIMKNKINLKGLHIPIIPEIYEPVLAELEQEGIIFKETTISQ